MSVQEPGSQSLREQIEPYLRHKDDCDVAINHWRRISPAGNWTPMPCNCGLEQAADRLASLAQPEEESIFIQHARKQGAADGFQQGWHAAIARIREGDTTDQLAELVPSPSQLASLEQEQQEAEERAERYAMEAVSLTERLIAAEKRIEVLQGTVSSPDAHVERLEADAPDCGCGPDLCAYNGHRWIPNGVCKVLRAAAISAKAQL